MMLAKRDDEWFLAAFAPSIHGCNLSAALPPKRHAERFHLWQDRIYVESHASRNGITFFPELRYHGYRVHPQGWHHDSPEPLVKCYLDQSDVSFGGWEETQKTIARLVADGWQWSTHEGGIKYIHVDDLEKIEGPPPEGAF